MDGAGLLVVTLDATGRNAIAEPEGVPVDERGIARDPDEVSKRRSPGGLLSARPRDRTRRASWSCLVAGTTWAALGVLTAACSKAPRAESGDRYLYVVGCDARVVKLDTVMRKKVDSFRLSTRSGSPPAVPDDPDGTMDGCLSQYVIADAATGRVSLVAPTEARLDTEGLQTFRILTFALPDWRLVASLPAGKAPEAPRIRIVAGKGVIPIDDAGSVPVTLIDLGAYVGRGVASSGLVLASSGGTSLLSLLSAESTSLRLGLADPRTRTVARLDGLPVTTFRHARLAPGGSHVLVEVMDGTATGARMTGELQLYDARGRRVGTWTDARLRGAHFVALTPNGNAVYRSGADFLFIPLDARFADLPVTQPIPEPLDPGLVYSGR